MLDAADSPELLEKECGVWSRYLVDRLPSSAVLARYQDAQAQGVVEGPA